MGANELLKKPPNNLKDAIDWILWFCNYGKGSKDYTFQLAFAVNQLTDFKTEFNGKFGQVKDPDGLINSLGKGLAGFLGYSGTSIIGDEGIAQTSYTSKYHEATWNGSNDSTVLAANFLGAAIITFLGLTYIYWRCSIGQHDGGWKTSTLCGSRDPLNLFMSTVGFNPSSELQNKLGSELVKRMTHEIHGFSELEKPAGTSSSYETFFPRLESNTAGTAINRPLASCFKLATSYFESHKSEEAKQITSRIETRKQELINLSKNTSADFVTLKSQIADLLQKVEEFNPNKEAEKFGQGVHNGVNQAGKEGSGSGGQSSPAAPVAGTLTTLSLGGGAAAAYLFNLGGAKTLVNGLLRIG
ncbi:variant erythrocyte surface antigen-1 family protein [Babesia caballi]|uniref:Variant erythrocyte surface antigen-1 family protein n=1 Tax=Babesia caballi TaxID=5871 RepID=A0AAV4LYC4_BABCB|nr:variant erythrocyte surface antigen-1 family protein [Babesia caballi]